MLFFFNFPFFFFLTLILFDYVLIFVFGGYAYTLSEQEKSRTERIEEDLAKARAAIQKAINNQNYTSDDKIEFYVPEGCVYRNAKAFHQLSSFFFKETFLQLLHFLFKETFFFFGYPFNLQPHFPLHIPSYLIIYFFA